VYCATIAACHSIYDVRRAREWTEALTKWCDAQPELVPFRGPCLVHRAEILRLGGAWSDAMTEAERARQYLQDHVDFALADACYQQAELHRLRGQFSEAEAAYRQASLHGREPQPGLALLRVTQGQTDAAQAAIRRVVEEPHDPIERAGQLAAFVEIMLAVDDVDAARSAASELAGIADEFQSPFLRAASAYAGGAIALADGDAATAIGSLRQAWSTWCDVDAPDEAARARALIGVACRDLGDDDTATMEFDAARRAFTTLGAMPELARLERLTAPAPVRAAGGLTGREIEVLELVAAGKTNRQIAAALVISEKTVARHVSNIFTKLGVSTRSAATGYAYQHGLA
jgi:DNA-binding NarL/FixJ family response regulator